MTDIPYATITELADALGASKISSVELTTALLDHIREIDPSLGAFVRLTEERALSEARSSDERRARGASLGLLDGIPYAVKDIYDVAGTPTMAGLSILKDNVAGQDCHAVGKLAKAGMVLIGKTHTVQLAFAITGYNGDLGTPHNPWRSTHYLPGGSSSGSAVAVSAGMVPVALGSDTAGSIRVPAAFCGIVGLKPTGGRLGRSGVRPLSWSLDTIGPMTRSTRDAAMVLAALQGPDPGDETTLMTPPIEGLSSLGDRVDGMDVMICDTLFFDDCDKEVSDAIEGVADVLASLGARVSHGHIPELEEVSKELHQNTIMSTEAYAVNGSLLEQHRESIDSDGHWMEEGKSFSGTEYYCAVRTRMDLQGRVSQRLRGVDAVLSPTTFWTAIPLETMLAGHGPKAFYGRNTLVANYLNLSSISVPCGFSEKGMPIGAMISAAAYRDTSVLQLAHAYEQASEWHLKRPDLSWVR